nr:DUF1963 domain-containing protein [Streptomyces sp. A1499]
MGRVPRGRAVRTRRRTRRRLGRRGRLPPLLGPPDRRPPGLAPERPRPLRPRSRGGRPSAPGGTAHGEDADDWALLATWWCGDDVTELDSGVAHWVIRRRDLADRRFDRVHRYVEMA